MTYYYTDYEELEALKVENIRLKNELNKLTDELIELKKKGAKNGTKRVNEETNNR